MTFVAYDVCRLCQIITFVAYDVCHIIGFVRSDVCHLIGFVSYKVCRIMTFVANYEVCRLGVCHSIIICVILLQEHF